MGQVIPFRRSIANEGHPEVSGADTLAAAQWRLWSEWARFGSSGWVGSVHLWRSMLQAGVRMLDDLVPEAAQSGSTVDHSTVRRSNGAVPRR